MGLANQATLCPPLAPVSDNSGSWTFPTDRRQGHLFAQGLCPATDTQNTTCPSRSCIAQDVHADFADASGNNQSAMVNP